MSREETVDQFFDSVNESYDALLDAVKSANDRGYRISRKLIDEVEQSQRDSFDLGRRFATAPADVAGFSASVVRSLTDAPSRSLGLARQLLDEVSYHNRKARDPARKWIEDSRQPGPTGSRTRHPPGKKAAPPGRARVNGVRARTTRKATAGTTKKTSSSNS